jgi:hypothetical protein
VPTAPPAADPLGEIRVTMHQPPLIGETPVDVRHSDRHWPRGAPIHHDLTTLETDGASEFAARKRDSILRNQSPTLEAAADPAERFGEQARSMKSIQRTGPIRSPKGVSAIKCWQCRCKTLFFQALRLNLMSPSIVDPKISNNPFCHKERRRRHQQ